MSEFLIIGVVIIGILLVIIEIFFIPGTTIFGIIGGVIMIAGVYLAYTQIDNQFGNLVLGGACVAAVGLTMAGLKVIQSNKFSMNEVVDGQVNQLDENIKVGDKGVTISYLRPGGKVKFDGQKIEVFSMGDYVEKDIEVEIVKINNNKIYVKPIQNT